MHSLGTFDTQHSTHAQCSTFQAQTHHLIITIQIQKGRFGMQQQVAKMEQRSDTVILCNAKFSKPLIPFFFEQRLHVFKKVCFGSKNAKNVLKPFAKVWLSLWFKWTSSESPFSKDSTIEMTHCANDENSCGVFGNQKPLFFAILQQQCLAKQCKFLRSQKFLIMQTPNWSQSQMQHDLFVFPNCAGTFCTLFSIEQNLENAF